MTATENEIVTVTVADEEAGKRLDRFLSDSNELDLSRNRIQKLIEDGLVVIADQPVNKKLKVVAGQQVRLSIPPTPKSSIGGEAIPLRIVHQDEQFLVIDKPAGLVTHPAPGHRSGTLLNAVIYHLGRIPIGGTSERPGIVHRLDKDTSGLIMVAVTEPTYQKLQKAIQARSIKRTYLALICGHVIEDHGVIDLPIGRSLKDRKKMAVTDLNSRSAVSEYHLKDRFRSYDLVEVTLHTGRTHQIRVHLSHLGHPVFGDPQYGGRQKWHRGIFAPERPLGKQALELMQRQALHACRLELEHPVTGQKMCFEADLPDDFASLMELLENEGR